MEEANKMQRPPIPPGQFAITKLYTCSSNIDKLGQDAQGSWAWGIRKSPTHTHRQHYHPQRRQRVNTRKW